MNVKKTMFVESLLLGETITEAAKKAGVSEATAYRWLKQGLRETVESRRKELFESNLNRLENSMTKAIDALNELIANRDAPPQPSVLSYTFCITVPAFAFLIFASISSGFLVQVKLRPEIFHVFIY